MLRDDYVISVDCMDTMMLMIPVISNREVEIEEGGITQCQTNLGKW